MKDVTQGGLGARIVITGATGFIGSNLARVFLEHGDHVFALVRPGSRHRDALPVHDNLTTVECDLDHVPDCIPAIGRADAFLHLAWGGVNREEIDSPKVQARNVSGSLDCVRTAARLGCTLFMDAGSRVEYGAVEGMMQEDVECHPVNQYGKAKLEFYQKAAPLCRELNMNYYHLRFFSVYGYGDHPWSIISTLVRDLRQNKRVSLSACRHQWNFMYIEDAVQAVYELYRHGVPSVGLRSCIVNIASSDTRPLRSFVEEIHKIAGFRGELEYGTFVQAKEGALSIRPDIGRLLGLTGGDWKEEYTFCRGIEETIEKEEANKRHEEDQRIDSLL
ncbi:NAD-dependent epimerase/dehydratase family protein [Enterocloster citroniae]|uniref:NAD-dependent epimerase/dehydratase family protein n=1 Tax=Enterocloster citroniae TaxID=358743 RepID=UPI001D08CF56|nr:NAD-dependent epimerase/dehydratase family protein [Enterocloster citroniae]MCB7066766.1 NAD-dependent epimerase/dehydratase family protein [Enterocloster citroniae]